MQTQLFLLFRKDGDFMQLIKKELKTTFSLLLAVMLIMSLMSGMLTLSASADGNVDLAFKNEAIMMYRYYDEHLPYEYNY